MVLGLTTDGTSTDASTYNNSHSWHSRMAAESTETVRTIECTQPTSRWATGTGTSWYHRYQEAPAGSAEFGSGQINLVIMCAGHPILMRSLCSYLPARPPPHPSPNPHLLLSLPDFLSHFSQALPSIISFRVGVGGGCCFCCCCCVPLTTPLRHWA